MSPEWTLQDEKELRTWQGEVAKAITALVEESFGGFTGAPLEAICRSHSFDLKIIAAAFDGAVPATLAEQKSEIMLKLDTLSSEISAMRALLEP